MRLRKNREGPEQAFVHSRLYSIVHSSHEAEATPALIDGRADRQNVRRAYDET